MSDLATFLQRHDKNEIISALQFFIDQSILFHSEHCTISEQFKADYRLVRELIDAIQNSADLESIIKRLQIPKFKID